MYGAKKGKILNMFIDDLSLPQRDQYGTQEVNEVSLTLHLFPLDLIFATEMRLEYTVRHKKFAECRFFVFSRTKCCDQQCTRFQLGTDFCDSLFKQPNIYKEINLTCADFLTF